MATKKTNTVKVAIGIIICCSLLFSCNDQNKKVEEDSTNTTAAGNLSLIKSAVHLVRDGDLVTRSDDDFESLSLQNFSKRDRRFSHSGIVFKEDNNYYVYNAVAGPENLSGSIKKDLIDSFVNPLKKTGFAIFRYHLSTDEINDLHALYRNYFTEKLPFDNSFNLSTDDSMYCSEIIYKSLKKITKNRLTLPTSTLTNFKPKMPGLQRKNIVIKNFEYVGLDDLYINPFCTEIVSVLFK